MVSNELKQAAEYIRVQVGLRERWRWNPQTPIYVGDRAVSLETGDRTTIVIHHTGYTRADDPKPIQDEHMKPDPGYGDIGYHYCIHPAGYGWVGRDIYYKGSHVQGQNGGKIGILMMGDYHQGEGWSNGGKDFATGYRIDPISEPQIRTCLRLINVLKQVFPVEYLGGHRDFLATDCPGDQLYPFIAGWRQSSGLAAPVAPPSQGAQAMVGGGRSSRCCG